MSRLEYRFKQVILVIDLGISLGKTAVQVAHGAVSAAEEARVRWFDWWRGWMDEGQCKVALKVGSEDELFKFEDLAEAGDLPKTLIRDKGLTEIPPGTVTCLAIGPAPSDRIDRLTGRLPLL